MEASFSRRLTALFACLLLVCSAAAVFGQGIVAGSLNGTIEDQQHAVVPGATVTAVSTATNTKYTTTTNNTGYFSLNSLPVGPYNVTVEAPKFSKLTINGVQVNANVGTSLGARALSVGTETVVTVADTAPLVQSDAINISGTFETKKAADLPVGNGFDSLALYTPGVVDSAGANFSNANGPGLSANGQRGRSNNFQVDGQYNNDNSVAGPALFVGNQDLLQEVQVLTNYDAQYGRNMGSVVNYVTKQGTNAFHGDAFEIYNGNWADSMANQDKSPLLGFCTAGQDPTATGCTEPKVPRLVDNRFGGVMGGPILKDKLWFFGSGNFERQRVGSTLFNSAGLVAPTPAGISQLQAAFPGNAAVSAISKIGPAGITGVPITFNNLQTVTVSDGVTSAPVQFGDVTASVPSIFNDYEGSGRIDYQISPKDRFFGRYLYQQQIFTNVNVLNPAQGAIVNEPSRTQDVGLDYVRDFTSNFINQARFSYSRSRVAFEGGSAFPTCLNGSPNNCPTSVTFLDGFTQGLGQATNMPQSRLNNTYTYQDNGTWVLGRHTVKFGGEYDRQRSPNTFLPDLNGSYIFNDFNSFLANTPAAVTFALGQFSQDFKENDLAFYGQDDWRIKDNFTFTFGLRWEWEQQAINLLHDETVQRESNPATAFWDTNLPLSLRTVPKVDQDLNNFGPVVGFAYTPRFAKSVFGEDKTVIRGGFRVAYDPAFYNIFENVATSTPTVDLATFGCTGCLPASGFGTDVVPTLTPLAPLGHDPGRNRWTTVAPNFHNPYTEQWQFGIQREITHGIVGEVRYVGNHDVGQFQDVNANPAIGTYQKELGGAFASIVPAGFTPCTTPGTPGFASGYADCTKRRVLERANTGFSLYHALQSELRMSNFHGVTAGLAYTWSHTIDNSNEVFNPGANTLVGLAYPQNPFSVAAGEKANSLIDFPNVASLYILYDTPWYKGQSGWKGRLLGGWQINPVWRYNSGQPWTAVETRFVGNGAGAGFCDPTGTFSTTFSACNPFLSNAGAPIGSAGVFCDAAAGNCVNPAGTSAPVPNGTLVNQIDPCFSQSPTAAVPCSFTPITASSVHWIANTAFADTTFGTLFGARRNLQRGDVVNTLNLSLFKNVKVNERLTVQLRSILYNVTNSQYLGQPDGLLDDGGFNPATGKGSFGNTFFNNNGNGQFNTVFDGIDRRRLEVGAKLIF